jgi:hypothetical protein
VETLRLEETWCRGGENDDIVFGWITEVASDDAGNIYVFDAQLVNVLVFAPDGELLRTLFREGEGPGEVRGPSDMAVLGDGSVALLMAIPATLVRVTPTGDPLPSIRYQAKGDSLSVGYAVCARGDHLLIALSHQTTEGSTQSMRQFLEKIDYEGRPQARLWRTDFDLDLAHLVFSEADIINDFMWRSTLGPDGKSYVAPDHDRYAIYVYHPDGSLSHVIERDYEHRQRSQFEIDRIRGVVDRMFTGAPFEVTVQVAPHDPDVGSWRHPSLRVAADGTLWVLSSHGCHNQPEGILQTFDVFSPEGHFVKQVAVACEGDGAYDGLFFVKSDHIVQVTRLADSMITMVFSGVAPEIPDDEEIAPVMVRCLRVVE